MPPSAGRWVRFDPLDWVTAQETKTQPDRFVPGIDETIQFQLGFPGGAVAARCRRIARRHVAHR